MKVDNYSIKLYTRESDGEGYSVDIGNGVYIAYKDENGEYVPFNDNFGMLYVTSPIDEKNTIVCKGLKNPTVCRLVSGDYMIMAPVVNNTTGVDEDTKGFVAVWTTKDFTSFSPMKMLYLNFSSHIEKVHVSHNDLAGRYEITWMDTKGACYSNSCSTLPEGDSMGSPVLAGFPGKTEDKEAFAPLISKIEKADEIDIPAETFESLKEKMLYDDSLEDKNNPLTSTFPLATGWADPQIFMWKGRYYFIATNDNNNNIGIFVRESDTVMGLFDAEPILILDKDEEKKLIQNFWAPEFHVINDDLYILFAVSPENFGPQCHMMKLKKDGNICEAGDWEAPVRVKKMDGSFLADKGITLDMTYFEAGGRSYLCWSYREHIFSELDTGSMLFIATIDKADPYVLTSEPVLLSRPLWGWEYTEGTINNEGPFALVRNGIVYLAFSGGSAGSYSYAEGFLIANENDDLLNVLNWYKKTMPIQTSYTVEGEFGPGHNSFFEDVDGTSYIVYHAKEAINNAPRCTGVKKLGFHKDGEPYVVK